MFIRWDEIFVMMSMWCHLFMIDMLEMPLHIHILSMYIPDLVLCYSINFRRVVECLYMCSSEPTCHMSRWHCVHHIIPPAILSLLCLSWHNSCMLLSFLSRLIMLLKDPFISSLAWEFVLLRLLVGFVLWSCMRYAINYVTYDGLTIGEDFEFGLYVLMDWMNDSL